jgi:hypothetical protein
MSASRSTPDQITAMQRAGIWGRTADSAGNAKGNAGSRQADEKLTKPSEQLPGGGGVLCVRVAGTTVTAVATLAHRRLGCGSSRYQSVTTGRPGQVVSETCAGLRDEQSGLERSPDWNLPARSSSGGLSRRCENLTERLLALLRSAAQRNFLDRALALCPAHRALRALCHLGQRRARREVFRVTHRLQLHVAAGGARPALGEGWHRGIFS